MAIAFAISGCGSYKEIAQSVAKPGEILASSNGTIVKLVSPFRPGQPNGLFDGVISLSGTGNKSEKLIEVNAVCSLPNEKGWPDYDNLYGRTVQDPTEARGPTGKTDWQILYKFSGDIEVAMGNKPGAWADRLRDNLCRRGDFDDRK
jgi:hypothetical protein